MAYEIYLDDKLNNQYCELDCDVLDLTTVFAISDINNISARKDTYTHNVVFAGTERNNKAFGFAFHLNKNILVTDELEDGGGAKLFYNYNPQILVDCFVYENGTLVLKGSMRLLSTSINSNGTYSYKTVITGDLKTFNDYIGDKVLTDLDLSSMKHTFNYQNIEYNWNNDPKSMGYVYPIIHNGHKFNDQKSISLDTVNPFQIKNFKPAVFVTTILDKIFEDSNLQIDKDQKTRVGVPFNYRIEGSEAFKTEFSNLIIPNNQEKISNKIAYTGGNKPLRLFKSINDTSDTNLALISTLTSGFGIRLNNKNDNNSLVIFNPAFFHSPSPTSVRKDNIVFSVAQSFTSSVSIQYKLNYMNKNSQLMDLHIQLISRNSVKSNEDAYFTYDGWDVMSEDVKRLNNTGGNYVDLINTFILSDTQFAVGKQYQLRFLLTYEDGASTNLNNFNFTLSETVVGFPANINQSIDVEVDIDSPIIPTLPTGIKQIDFIASLRNLLNLYVYVDTDTRTVIFEPYDDYYSSTKGLELFSKSLDWSNKIDRSSNIEITSNTNIVKKYNYTWKNDSDYINDTYQKQFAKSYGDQTLSDINGIAEKKDVSLIFSPTPIVLAPPAVKGQGGFSIPIPWIYKMDGADVAPLTTNIRILHYNGVRTVDMYNIITEKYDVANSKYTSTKLLTNRAVLASNFIMDGNGNFVKDLHFGEPAEIFFTKKYTSIPSSYSNYENQINELRNANVTYVACEAYLNENDINQLDLSVPIFLDFGVIGNGYWKILEIKYVGNNRTSTIQLQKIIV